MRIRTILDFRTVVAEKQRRCRKTTPVDRFVNFRSKIHSEIHNDQTGQAPSTSTPSMPVRTHAHIIADLYRVVNAVAESQHVVNLQHR